MTKLIYIVNRKFKQFSKNVIKRKMHILKVLGICNVYLCMHIYLFMYIYIYNVPYTHSICFCFDKERFVYWHKSKNCITYYNIWILIIITMPQPGFAWREFRVKHRGDLWQICAVLGSSATLIAVVLGRQK